jgi:hypothetical protein
MSHRFANIISLTRLESANNLSQPNNTVVSRHRMSVVEPSYCYWKTVEDRNHLISQYVFLIELNIDNLVLRSMPSSQ